MPVQRALAPLDDGLAAACGEGAMARKRRLQGVELAQWYGNLPSLNVDDARRDITQTQAEADVSFPLAQMQTKSAPLTASGS